MYIWSQLGDYFYLGKQEAVFDILTGVFLRVKFSVMDTPLRTRKFLTFPRENAPIYNAVGATGPRSLELRYFSGNSRQFP